MKPFAIVRKQPIKAPSQKPNKKQYTLNINPNVKIKPSTIEQPEVKPKEQPIDKNDSKIEKNVKQPVKQVKPHYFAKTKTVKWYKTNMNDQPKKNHQNINTIHQEPESQGSSVIRQNIIQSLHSNSVHDYNEPQTIQLQQQIEDLNQKNQRIKHQRNIHRIPDFNPITKVQHFYINQENYNNLIDEKKNLVRQNKNYERRVYRRARSLDKIIHIDGLEEQQIIKNNVHVYHQRGHKIIPFFNFQTIKINEQQTQKFKQQNHHVYQQRRLKHTPFNVVQHFLIDQQQYYNQSDKINQKIFLSRHLEHIIQEQYRPVHLQLNSQELYQEYSAYSPQRRQNTRKARHLGHVNMRSKSLPVDLDYEDYLFQTRPKIQHVRHLRHLGHQIKHYREDDPYFFKDVSQYAMKNTNTKENSYRAPQQNLIQKKMSKRLSQEKEESMHEQLLQSQVRQFKPN